MTNRKVVDWLLEPDQPSIRYRTLTELLDRPDSDPDVREARKQLSSSGWAADILSRRLPGKGWPADRSLYLPKYLSTNWMMLILSDLGMTRDLPDVAAACEYWMAGFPLEGGGVGGNSKGTGHHCVVGNMARALILFGYAEDPRVRRSLEWLVETASPLGGWSCFGRGRNLDSWEGLSAFAALPRAKWTNSMRECVEGAAEFYLSRELHRQGGRYEPWYRLHYPVHYYYDLLVGLDLLTSLGYQDDARLRFGLTFLRRKQRKDGRWNLDAAHPDVGEAMARWFAGHPSQRPTPFSLETPGAPSKMVTLRALTVLKRVDGAAV